MDYSDFNPVILKLLKEIEERSKALDRIRSQYGGSLARAYKEVKRQEYIEFVQDIIGIDASMLTESQLRNAINIASEKARNDSRGSPTFYEYLEQEIMKEMQ